MIKVCYITESIIMISLNWKVLTLVVYNTACSAHQISKSFCIWTFAFSNKCCRWFNFCFHGAKAGEIPLVTTTRKCFCNTSLICFSIKQQQRHECNITKRASQEVSRPNKLQINNEPRKQQSKLMAQLSYRSSLSELEEGACWKSLCPMQLFIFSPCFFFLHCLSEFGFFGVNNLVAFRAFKKPCIEKSYLVYHMT